MAWPTSDHSGDTRRFLLAAGTAEYDHQEPLPSVPGDLDRVTALFARLGAEAVRVDGRNPRGKELQQWLGDWLYDPGRLTSDALVVYYSGHGASAEDDRHYLMVADTNSNRLALTAVPTEELAFLLADSTVRSVLVLLDTCYAGHGADDLAAAFIRAVRGQPVRSSDAVPSGLWVIAAARRKDAAKEGAFVQALAAAVDDERHGGVKQPYLDVPAVVSAVNDELRRWGVPQRAIADAVEVGGPCLALPNPRYVAGLPEGISVAEQRRLLGDLEHWDPRARGVATEADAGWNFTGRRRVLTELAAWLAGSGLDRRPRIVTGGPGSGKSAVLSRLVTLSDPAYRRRVPAEELARGPTVPPGVIDAAVVARGKTLEELTAEVAQAVGVNTKQPAVLAAVVARHPERLTIVVDALDEALEPHAIAHQLLVPLVHAASATDLRLLVATRPHLLSAFGDGISVMDLDDDRYLDPADIEEYVLRLLGGEPGSPYRGAPELAAAAAEAIAGKAGKSFLVARVYATMFATASAPTDITSPSWHERPAAIGAVLEQDLARLGPDPTWARDLLRPLAYAEGAGLPWADLWAPLAAALAGRPYDNDDIHRLLNEAGSYVVEGVEDQRSVYRLYHQAFTDHLRDPSRERDAQRRIAQMLWAQSPTRPGGAQTDWRQAHPYVLTHLATHAAAGGLLEKLVTDPLYLAAADPDRLGRVIGMMSAGVPSPAADAYELVLHHLRASSDGQNAAYLEFAARSACDRGLADQFGSLPVRQPWSVRWVQWRPTPPNRVLGRHNRGVYAIAFLEHDGRPIVASGDYEGDVRVWDVPTGRLLWSVPHGSKHLSLTAGTLGGRPVLMVKADGLRLYDLLTGELLVTISSRLALDVLGFAEIEGRPAWTGRHGIYDFATGAIISHLTHHVVIVEQSLWRRVEHLEQRPFREVAFGELQGRLIAVTAHDAGGNQNIISLIQVWDAETGTSISSIRHEDIITALAVGEYDDRPVLAVGGYHGRLRPEDIFPAAAKKVAGNPDAGFLAIKDLMTGEPIAEIPHRGMVTQTAIVRHNNRPVVLAANGYDNKISTVEVWDPTSGEYTHGLDLRHQESVHATALGAIMGRAVAASAGSRIVRVSRLPVTAKASDITWWGHDGPIEAIAVGAYQGQRAIISAGHDATVRVWDLATGWPRHGFLVPHSRIRAIAAATWRGRSVVVWVGGGGRSLNTTRLQLWDLERGKELRVPHNVELPSGVLGDGDVAVTHLSGRQVAVAHAAGTVCTWDINQDRVISRFSARGGPWSRFAIGILDGRTALVSGGGDLVQVFDLATGVAVGVLPIPGGHDTTVTVAGADEHAVIAALSRDMSGRYVIHVWNLATGTSIGTLDVPDHYPAASITGGQLNGRPIVITGSWNGAVFVWDLSRRIQQQTIEFDSRIHGLEFVAPDSVVVAADDGLALIRLSGESQQ